MGWGTGESRFRVEDLGKLGVSRLVGLGLVGRRSGFRIWGRAHAEYRFGFYGLPVDLKTYRFKGLPV